MQTESELLNESKRRSDIVSTKLNAVLEILKPRSQSISPLSADELSRQLFSRAPVEFLDRSTPDELAQIALQSGTDIKNFDPRNSPVKITTVANHGSLLITLVDRPFIVNTIMECCRERDLRVLTLLHPIVQSGSQKLSINYLVVDSTDQGELKRLSDQVQSALLLLIPVTDDFPKMVQKAEGLASSLKNSPEEKEAADFLGWLGDGAFNFIGAVEFDVAKGKEPTIRPNSAIGLFGGDSILANTITMELLSDVRTFQVGKHLVTVSGLLTSSPVHRRIRMTHVLIAPRDANVVQSFVGLFTSRALSQECSTIPLIRRKFEEIIRTEGFVENTHDYKSVANIVDSLPKDEALSLDTHSLRSIVTSVMDVATSSETVVSIWADPQSRGLSVMVVLLRERFATGMRENIAQFIRETFKNQPTASEYHLDITNRPVVRLYYHVPCSPEMLRDIDMKKFRNCVASHARSWNESLEIGLTAHSRNGTARKLSDKYAEAFDEDYRALQNTEDCVRDIQYMEQLSAEKSLRVALANFSPEEPHKATIVTYSLNQQLTISRVLPALENAGFEVINERSWRVHLDKQQTIYSNRFRVHTHSGVAIKPILFSEVVAPGLETSITTGRDNDPLNSLMLEVDMNIRAVGLMRTYCRALWQVSKFASRFSIIKTVANHPQLTARLWRMFELKFNPNLDGSLEARQAQFQQESISFLADLRQIKDITSDRVFRSLRALMEHTVRTNFYRGLDSIALKFRSELIDIMPQPRPKFEVFVAAPIVEGIHLRSGSVARGGIRWSDRPDDYRSEVLGLMKTQRVKNALIVPTGAKGGFIAKQLPADPKQIPGAVQNAYIEYIRALLSLADNRVGGAVVHPDKVLCYDGEDPYFVVAADKGTATFSDTANRIAVEEHNFWLGDAFASGGSNGYDHKLYAITAKGAWECVKRHFRDIELPFEDRPFTAVGIGDMSGDVFGNGLLLSGQYKLLAAFNHKHIFVDPNPDPTRSLAERKRLFELKGSQWSDYDRKLISTGGAIFDRYEKEIRLSAEARTSLDIGASMPETMSGDEVVNAILKAPVDLLWNGGIGTYVKSSSQSHADVSDSANDAVRVNSEELRAKVIGEGGNLGFTQLARIEFAKLGGRINTDAIDNSGGVDLSDHEVNLKILFSGLIQEGKISVPDRNKLLKEMASEVCEAVLEHNRGQALLLSLATKRSMTRLHYFQSLLRELVKLGYVNRDLDALPDDDELADRAKEGHGLTRPELAVCIATVKMWVKDSFLSSALIQETLLDPLLLEYFPLAVQERFRSEALKHPLRPNILATQSANILIDCMGITAFHRLSNRHGVPASRVVECSLAAETLLNTRGVRRSLMMLDEHVGSKTYLVLSEALGSALFELTNWLLGRHQQSVTIAELVPLYRSAWQELLTSPANFMPDQMARRVQDRLKAYRDLGLTEQDARILAISPEMVLLCEMVWTARESKLALPEVAPIYGGVMNALSADSLLASATSVEARSRWDSELLQSSLEDIRRGVSMITVQLLSRKVAGPALAHELGRVVPLERWRAGVEELKARSTEVASVAVLARNLQNYAQLLQARPS